MPRLTARERTIAFMTKQAGTGLMLDGFVSRAAFRLCARAPDTFGAAFRAELERCEDPRRYFNVADAGEEPEWLDIGAISAAAAIKLLEEALVAPHAKQQNTFQSDLVVDEVCQRVKDVTATAFDALHHVEETLRDVLSVLERQRQIVEQGSEI